MTPIDLVEIEPGIYGIEPVDPYAHQWRAFWRMIRFLVIGIAIVVSIDLLVT